MKLIFESPWASIERFDDVELPQFVVISGLNGSGKTQILEGIAENRFLLTNEEPYEPTPPDPNAKAYVPSPRLSVRYVKVGELIDDQMTQEEMRSAHQVPHYLADLHAQAVSQAHDQYARRESPTQNHLDFVRAYLRQELRVPETALSRTETIVGKSLIEMTGEEFELAAPVTRQTASVLSKEALRVLTRYRARESQNVLQRMLHEQEPTEHGAALTEGDFRDVYGPPPWDLLNGILADMGLKFSFERPKLARTAFEAASSELELPTPSGVIDQVSGRMIGLDKLSTGEKILLRIALSLYEVSAGVEARLWPEAILLDEPDAFLHPSMVRQLLTLLERVFVEQLGIAVVITTHSPTTVALAPEDSLYSMTRDGSISELTRVSKDFLISQLTDGVPTLSVNVEARRVVMVENLSDAERYEATMRTFREPIFAERTLQFVPGGGRSGTNGRQPVKEIVDYLRERGNLAVWGVVDRDDSWSDTDHVLAIDQDRYAIENVILDPLSIGFLAVIENYAEGSALGFPAGVRLPEFNAADGQPVVDAVCAKVFPSADLSERRTVSYAGGFTLAVPLKWLDIRGHDLDGEDSNANGLIQNAIKYLGRFKKDLPEKVIEAVWRNFPDVRPQSIEVTFRKILEAP